MKLPKVAVVLGLALVTASVEPASAAGEEAKPAVPLVPEVTQEETAQQKAYPLTVNWVGITTKENQVTPKVYVSLKLEDAAQDPDLVGIRDYHVTTLLTDTGLPATPLHEPSSFEQMWSSQAMPEAFGPRPHAVFLHFACDLPPGAKELAYVDGTAMLVRAGTRTRILWDDPPNQLQQKRTTADGGELTLTNYSLLGETLFVAFDNFWPEAEGGLGAMGRMRTMAVELYFTDHSSTRTYSGGAYGKHRQYNFNNLKKRTPAAFEVSFIPSSAVTQSPQRLTLRHVALPPHPEAQLPPGPRGSHQIAVDDYTFSIQYLTAATMLSKGPPQRTLQMRLGVKAPAGTNTMNATSTFKSITALDDAGNTTKVSDALASMAIVEIPLRDPQSDRIVSLKGTYSVPTITDWRQAHYILPEGELANGALKQGPVTLRTLHTDAADLHLEWDIAMDEMPESVRSPEGSHGLGDPPYVTADLYDVEGKVLAFVGGWTVQNKVYRMSGLLKPGFEADTFVVRYATQIGVREIPFAFEDIGIPRAIGASTPAAGGF